MRALFYYLLISASVVANADADEYDDLGCYVGNMSRAEFYAARDRAALSLVAIDEPDRFKAGDVVTVRDWDDQYRITGQQVYRYSERSKRYWWYYPATNQRTGKSGAWLVERDLAVAPTTKTVAQVAENAWGGPKYTISGFPKPYGLADAAKRFPGMPEWWYEVNVRLENHRHEAQRK